MLIVRTFSDLFSRKTPLAARLWRGGGLVAAFIGTLMVGNLFVSRQRAVTWDMLGHDFLAFYYGGTCALTGHYERLYDLPATRVFEHNTGTAAGLSLGTSFGPWWNPPFAAWLFAPFAALPYLTALHAWWVFSGVCLTASMFLLAGMLRGGWKIKLLLPFLVVLSMPCFQVFCHGQNTCFSLLLLTTTVWLWRKNRGLLAGMVCGLLFYKPQLGAVIAAVLCVNQGRRAVLGVCLTGAALALANVLLMPGSLYEFAYHMPLNLHWIQEENLYRWERHVTLKSFWRLVFQGDTVGVTQWSTRVAWYASELMMGAALIALVIRTLREGRSACARDRLIAATIAAMPLVMPFYFDYDLLLLTVGIVVYAADRQRELALGQEANGEDRAVVAVWVGIFLVTMLWKWQMGPLVPLLVAAAGLLIRRAFRATRIPAVLESPRTLPSALAA
jgi:alpha-1,2-mannosyltransferase